MWAYKVVEEHKDSQGNPYHSEIVNVEESWYDILFQSFMAFWLGFWLLIIAVLCAPIAAIWAGYRQYKYSNCPFPADEVRERAHLA